MHSEQIGRRQFVQYGALSLGTSVLAACTNPSQRSKPSTSAGKKDKVKLGLSWVAEAEYGGFYQALAQGLYKEVDLDVTIVPGGPRINGSQLLLGGELDFYLADRVLVIDSANGCVNQEIPVAIPRPRTVDFRMSVSHSHHCQTVATALAAVEQPPQNKPDSDGKY